jgi:hypothetical protein
MEVKWKPDESQIKLKWKEMGIHTRQIIKRTVLTKQHRHFDNQIPQLICRNQWPELGRPRQRLNVEDEETDYKLNIRIRIRHIIRRI